VVFKVILLAALAVSLDAADLVIDHVTAGGRDLKTMQANLAAIGIQSEYGGPHSNHATEMALTSFPDGSYLELIAIQPNADPQALAMHYWAKHMQSDAGPTAFAVRPKDIAAEVKRLAAAGIQVTEPVRAGRARPDGVRLDWETANVGSEPNGTFFPFMIRDFTPRAQRAYPKGKPTNADFQGIARVVIAVHDLDAAAARYRKAYGLQAPLQQVDANFGAHLAYLGGTPVILAAPLNAQSWLTERLSKVGEGPCAFILRMRKGGGYKAVVQTRWFGTAVSWFDESRLGWRLGFE
jgi:glyoxalase-like protein